MLFNMNFVVWVRSSLICSSLIFKLLTFSVASLLVSLSVSRCAHETSSSKNSGSLNTSSVGESLLLLYVSDLHSQLRANRDGRGGYAQLAAWIESEKSKAGPQTDVFVLGGGDLVGKGSLPCQNTQDKECAPLLRDLHLDFATLGNYELYQSPQDLAQMIRASGVRYLSSNVELKREAQNASVQTPWLQGPQRLEGKKSGLSVWLYSWTGSFDVNKSYRLRQFPSPSDWSALKQRTSGEAVVFMTHMELTEDQSFLRDACLQLAPSNQIVALLKANDHRSMNSDLSQCVPILEPGAFGHYALKVLLTPVKGQKAFHVNSEFVEIKGFKENAHLAQKIEALYKKYAPEADKTLFTLTQAISREDLAKWVADSYRVRTRADAAIVNVGYVKHGLPSGPVSQEEFLMALPYANELQGMDWPTKSLEKALCDVSRAPKDKNLDWGSDLYFSGFSLENPGTPQCKITGTQKSSLKVVMDSYLVSRSARWLGRDVSKQVFRFGVDSRRVGFLHVKDNPPRSRP